MHNGLLELSTRSAVLILLVCATMAAIGETNAKIDNMALAIETLQTSPLADFSAITAFQASVQDLSGSGTAGARVRGTPACAPPVPAP